MSTQIFISWSGNLSREVATLLHAWIPTVLQSAEPFLSSTDIEKGARWSDHVAQKLEECGFGIIVLTSVNLTAPWILFESGALSKMVGRSHVSALLIDVDLVDVKQPLSQFQNTVFTRDDMHKLVQAINRAGPVPLKDEILAATFNALWPGFESSVKDISRLASEEKTGMMKESDSEVSSIKGSIGELIQAFQQMKDETRRSSQAFDSADLMREIRNTVRRSRSLPVGLARDVRFALKYFEDANINNQDSNVMTNDIAVEAIERLQRAASYIDTLTSRPRAYPEMDERARPSLIGRIADDEDK